ncbi:fimbrial biogenesis chaperone [Arenimonas composti]|uniref:Pili assembly chaperone N-terminal domain-containing protein n=1 Tax=Arenimonas composti TR7-09 = DSM 18010 TaxID=1121013 RepID=A0A091C0Y3_9GAMM|nr:molecular chaperone [Arenimonas composti]KFN50285.1 hypothetical protein P873_06315 [Arenimonas composti TR7-09 = DSM 18010]
MSARAALVAGAVLLLAAGGVSARGQLQAGPTLLEIPSGANATRLQLGNTGDATVAAQVRVYAWVQEDGEDRLLETEALVASPPIAEVEAGGEHLVRLVLTGTPPAGTVDATFRVVVDELPGDPQVGETGVQMRMRYVIPAFVRAAAATPPAIECELRASELSCRNRGGQAAQLAVTALRGADGPAVVLSSGLFGYVLPESERRWTLPAGTGIPVGPLLLDTQLNGQAATIDVRRP